MKVKATVHTDTEANGHVTAHTTAEPSDNVGTNTDVPDEESSKECQSHPLCNGSAPNVVVLLVKNKETQEGSHSPEPRDQRKASKDRARTSVDDLVLHDSDSIPDTSIGNADNCEDQDEENGNINGKTSEAEDRKQTVSELRGVVVNGLVGDSEVASLPEVQTGDCSIHEVTDVLAAEIRPQTRKFPRPLNHSLSAHEPSFTNMGSLVNLRSLLNKARKTRSEELMLTADFTDRDLGIDNHALT